jgi:hypothetical protein
MLTVSEVASKRSRNDWRPIDYGLLLPPRSVGCRHAPAVGIVLPTQI